MGEFFNYIFKIPDRSLVGQRLTKTFFLRNFNLSSTEKKLLNNIIEQMEILGQINFEKSNIPSVLTETDSYENILIITCTVANNQLEKYVDNCTQFIQKYIAHQVILVIQESENFIINVAEKRINLVDKNKLVIVKDFSTPEISKLYKNEQGEAFFKALNFNTLDKTNLETVYKSYIEAVIQYQIASITGNYKKRTNVRTAIDMQHLADIEQLKIEIVSLVNQIKKERQLNSKIKLNILIKKNKDRIKELKEILESN
ncbi:DUF4391 domain-containing protein [Tenacibaculum finnmarkense]|uniref:DUF4391 domain-containing protein n=1 Tax=Tenacibaculum finnmarkense TaxID=2781243 RepID=UPI001EFA6E49|nr:DUF4391 domain-containing protein [Tenacibaculum finnmarkense]MCG8761956.1 DUF4391 domain-containing protein [Tenacibaculum finnmarkense]MCG8787331.1 DUF4391 domain-containing protein [Tenacibaculum finnmarkense]